MTSQASAATWTDREAVTGEYAKKVLAYTDCIKRGSFTALPSDKAGMGWDVYRGLLMMWGTTTDFWAEFHRISEVGNRVYLELTEHNHPRGGDETVVNSCTVYQFDDAGKLVHLDIYLQHE